MMRRLERNSVAADLAAVEGLLSGLSESSFLARMDLAERRDELRERLRALDDAEYPPLASVDLFFGGAPVIGSQGIESDFGGRAVADFQDIVAKLAAAGQSALGQRGPVAGADASRLHVTNIVRGSFGFELQELGDAPLFDSSLKASVDRAIAVMSAFDAEDDEAFGQGVEEIDERVLSAVRGFFELMDSRSATLRVVSDGRDKSFDHATIQRAAERAKVTTISDRRERRTGRLGGVLPGRRSFEFRSEDGAILFGKFAPSVPTEEIEAFAAQVGQAQDSVATLEVREISRPGRAPHLAYFLTELRPAHTGQN